MNSDRKRTKVDPILVPLLEASEQRETEHQLTELICERAEPLIRRIVRQKLRVSLSRMANSRESQDADDVCANVILKLVERLHKFKSTSSVMAIGDFDGYVAVMTFNECYQYLRLKRPERYTLKRRLRAVLSRHASFAIWETAPREWLCGLAGRDRNVVGHPARPDTLARVSGSSLEDGEMRGVGEAVSTSAWAIELADHATAILERAGGPVEFEMLVDRIGELQAAVGQSPASEVDPADMDRADIPVHHETEVAVALDRRTYLQRLWREICRLPEKQRAALLLNLRDSQGQDLMGVLALSAVATVGEMASALSITPEQLSKLWSELPLDDSTVASRLGATRQQVINLRNAARRRLARRMRAKEEAL